MATKIVYDKSIPRELRAQFKAMIDPLVARYTPSWVQEIRISWDQPCDSNVQELFAEAQPRYEYRLATIILYPAFLRATKGDQRAIIVHEICHLITAPILQFLQTTIGILVPDPSDPMRGLLAEQGRVAVESSTEDCTNIFLRHGARA